MHPTRETQTPIYLQRLGRAGDAGRQALPCFTSARSLTTKTASLPLRASNIRPRIFLARYVSLATKEITRENHCRTHRDETFGFDVAQRPRGLPLYDGGGAALESRLFRRPHHIRNVHNARA